MVPTFGLFIDAVLLALGIFWCIQMYGRWYEDLQFVRHSTNNTGRAVTLGLWVLTALIALFVINVVLNIIASIWSGLRSL